MKGRDTIALICNELIELIEAGAEKWTMPWHHTGNGSVPYNVTTGAAYRGGNWLQLMVRQVKAGYPTPQWATYKQFAAAGGQVRKGERGTPCVYWGRRDTINEGTGKVDSVMFPNGFTVFNVAQQDGYVPVDVELVEVDVDEQLAAWFGAIPATIIEGDPAYWPDFNRITMPAIEAFPIVDRFWATLSHELAHWTGHGDRLARDPSGRFGSHSYAFEELVAEMSSAFTCATLGIASEHRAQSAAYIKGWLQPLKADPSLLWTVAGLAQKATDHLASYQPTTEEEPCPTNASS